MHRIEVERKTLRLDELLETHKQKLSRREKVVKCKQYSGFFKLFTDILSKSGSANKKQVVLKHISNLFENLQIDGLTHTVGPTDQRMNEIKKD